MEQFLNIIAVIAFSLFIIYQIFEIVMSHKYYKKMKKQHQELIDRIVEETVEDMFKKEIKNDNLIIYK